MARNDRSVLASAQPAEAAGHEPDPAELLLTLAQQCVGLLPAVDAAAVLFGGDRGGPHVVAAAIEPAHVVAVRRLHLDDGPGPACLRTGRRFACPDVRGGDERWPRFAVTAARAGLRSAVTLPVRRHDTTVGAITLFSKLVAAPSVEELRIAQALVDAAAIGVMQRRDIDQHRLAARQLQLDLDGRVIIEQAKGMLAGRHDVDLDEAFEAMRSYARAHSLPLPELAQDIVAGSTDIM